MGHGGWFTRLRGHRFAIGLIAAFALLFGPLLTIAAASSDPFQDYLDTHLCAPEQAPGDPAVPSDHRHDCQLCGPGCPLGGGQSPAALSGGYLPIAFPVLQADRPAASTGAPRPVPALYPSDALSQAPPRAA